MRTLKRAINQNYHLLKLSLELQYRLRSLHRSNPVLVYQMGKVGSKSLMYSLRLAGVTPLFHVHTMTEEGPQHFRKMTGLPVKKYFPRARHIVVGEYLRREVERGLERGRWKVISAVRDPLDQTVSSLFQGLDLLPAAENASDVQDIVELLLTYYPPDNRLLRWFDVELKRVFDVDVFSSPFPTERGYAIYRGSGVDVLLMKLERMSHCAANAMREFLGLPSFRLVIRNAAREKRYADLYRKFRTQAVLPPDYVRAIYGSGYVRHFYSEQEVAKGLSWWLAPPAERAQRLSRST